jgi:hypothetical protein
VLVRVLLEHSIVGLADENFKFRKDREYAACRICGRVFQSGLAHVANDFEYENDPAIKMAIAIETKMWRSRHNEKHSEKEHLALHASGLTFTPEAAHRLAPYGIVTLDNDSEVASALLEAPRAPVDDVESS